MESKTKRQQNHKYRKIKVPIVSIACVLIAFLISLDLRIQWGWESQIPFDHFPVELLRWFDPADIHHETWMIAFLFLALGIFLATNFKWFRKTHRNV